MTLYEELEKSLKEYNFKISDIDFINVNDKTVNTVTFLDLSKTVDNWMDNVVDINPNIEIVLKNGYFLKRITYKNDEFFMLFKYPFKSLETKITKRELYV